MSEITTYPIPSTMRQTDEVCPVCQGAGQRTFGYGSYVCDHCYGHGKRLEVIPCEHSENPFHCKRCDAARDAALDARYAKQRQERLDRILGGWHGIEVRCSTKGSQTTCGLYSGAHPLCQPRSRQVFDKQLEMVAGVIASQRRTGRFE